jgi:hypothetical protein
MEGNGYVQYKAMVICTGLHLLLLMFEILACDNLETEHHSWILVFIPLMFMSVVSIGICVWAVKSAEFIFFQQKSAKRIMILQHPKHTCMSYNFIKMELLLKFQVIWNGKVAL